MCYVHIKGQKVKVQTCGLQTKSIMKQKHKPHMHQCLLTSVWFLSE